ncbi:hypothetical protein KSD_32170 [Ktedonobacter sp. SOSP1-85]|uniref:heme-binding protein n=1 Tax=Ktedonobacter sp. SOSP1-85 TaxID=2778367 RepID=UPI001915EEF4|nr:heme-binding protein [Ktedonobacter sp. SOSP1-85]GHO75446.1 hypothetical protein KSD_32170 [Ktedonobacter sp. SOSP1-85]
MSISIDIARKILEASKQRARELRSPVSIAIVDAGGHLVLFERMMSPYGWATGNISIAKASTAVMFNQSTDSVAQWGSSIPGFASSLAEMTHGNFIMAAGGWPIRVNGATVGGIGVSGGNAPGRDDEIARAGLAAFEAPRQAPPQPYAPPQPQQQPSFSGLAPQSPASSFYARGAAPQQPQQTPSYTAPSASYPVQPAPESAPREQNYSENVNYAERPAVSEQKSFPQEQVGQEQYRNEETAKAEPFSFQDTTREEQPQAEQPGDQS